MSQSWDPFMPPPELAAQALAANRARQQKHDDARALTRATFASGPGAAWLAMMLAEEGARASYKPGDSFDQVAWREGRKSWLRDIQAILTSEEPTP
jgi:hypothetical protein